MSFKKISVAQRDAFLSALRSGHYNLLLGAGASMDSKNALGSLPSGNELKKSICHFKGVSEHYSLQRAFSLLKPPEVELLVTRRFKDTIPGPTAKLIASFIWKRIFTWNIDDVLEYVYETNSARQKLTSLHFLDDYIETQNLSELPLIHLHGTVLKPDKGYVFSQTEYVDFIKKINHWMVVLTQFMQTEPMIISGTSLDEIDLDYYLSHRTSLTSRDDRGPSILVEKTDDAVTASICERHNLLHFVGYSLDFFNYCAELLPNRPAPYELIPLEMKKFIPESVSKNVALSFQSDFELVPPNAPKSSEMSRFLHGHPPTWIDLQSNIDISRPIVSEIVAEIEARLKNESLSRLIILVENAGTGKTTILRRVAFQLASQGVRTLLCSALGRIDIATASVIDLIDEPIVIVVDNFADQAPSFADFLDRIEKRDIVVLGSERAYRKRYLTQVLAGTPFKMHGSLSLRTIDIARLLDRYVKFGLVGDAAVLQNRDTFVQKSVSDPIAVACCRIMNDFRPLERIVDDLILATSKADLDSYLLVALAQHCFMGGVRFEVLIGALGIDQMREQFERDHPLPLAYSDNSKTFVICENSTLAERILAVVSKKDRDRLLNIFVALANAIGSRVNRQMIIRRTPESRLSVRLFDYDDVVRKFLGGDAAVFYDKVQPTWRWNSRYWEQVALLNLAAYFEKQNTNDGLSHLTLAVQHARHAVSVELHPFPLSTLGKVLMTQMLLPGQAMASIYDEAFARLGKAIELEASWYRHAIQPYASLFSGTINYLERNGALSGKQIETLQGFIASAETRFPHERELQMIIGHLSKKLGIT